MFDYLLKKPMNFSTGQPFYFRLDWLSRPVLLTVGAAAALLLMGAPARSADIAEPASASAASRPEAAASTPAASAATVAAAAPRYSASNLAMAFNYMDANHDGKISREEAAGFRGVAKNFERADTNHDGVLSRQEFDHAMNYVKPQ